MPGRSCRLKRIGRGGLPAWLAGSMMKRMSFSETIFLFFLALVVFGPKKLPEIARQIGKALNEFRRASNEFKAQIEQEIAHLEVEKPTILPPTPAVQGTTSRASQSVDAEAKPAEAPATLAATEQNPASAAPDSAAASKALTSNASASNGSSPGATEAVSPADAVTSNSSQESHA
jgi:sec-independent protein translocase protein TatB